MLLPRAAGVSLAKMFTIYRSGHLQFNSVEAQSQALQPVFKIKVSRMALIDIMKSNFSIWLKKFRFL